MRKKILVNALALTISMSMLVGCGSSNESTMTESSESTASTGTTESTSTNDGEMVVPSEIDLYVYYADSNIDVVDAALEVMKELYPDTDVVIEHRTDADGTVLKSRAAIGELPDVMELTSTIADPFADAGYLQALDSAMAEMNYFERFYDGAFDSKVAPDGNYYALASSVPEAYLMYYNRTVFADLGLEPPADYEAFKVVVQTLVDNGLTPLALFGAEKWPGLQLYDLAIIGQGQYDGISGLENGNGHITDSEYVVAAEKVEEVVSMGLVGRGALSTNASQAFELFEMGQAGMLVNGSWYLTDAVASGAGDVVGFFEYNPFADADMAEEVRGHLSAGTLSTGGFAAASDSEYSEFCTYWALDFHEQFAIAREEMGTPTLLVNKPSGIDVPQCILDYNETIENMKSTSLYGWSLSVPEVLVALENATELLVTANYPTADFLADLESDLSLIFD